MEWNEKQIQILDVAEELFAQKGFVGTSVRDIASKADINVAMISYYFGSKEKLLQGLLMNRTEQSRELLKQLNKDKHLDPWTKIEKLIDFYVAHLLNNRRFHIIMSRQISLTQDEAFIDLLIDIKKGNYMIIKEIIEEGQRKKVFRKVNIPLTIGTILGTISQISMSRPFYKKLLDIQSKDEEKYFKRLRPVLKTHLKTLLRGHLMIKD